jgi:hypothetical protein
MPTVQESSLSSEELAGLRQAVQAMEYVKDLLSRHPELVEDENVSSRNPHAGKKVEEAK